VPYITSKSSFPASVVEQSGGVPFLSIERERIVSTY